MKLAGVPFAVKNLFDIAALPTLAGSKIERDAAPAARDAVLVRRLEAEGAVLVGALNMDEYAYGFTTENTHYGATRNPHDLTRISRRLVRRLGRGGGGRPGADHAGLRHQRLDPRAGVAVRHLRPEAHLRPPAAHRLATRSVASLDHLGPFARSVADLALAYDLMQGPDTHDPACAQRDIEPVSPLLERGAAGLRVAVLGGWFREMALAEALAAVDAVAQALGTTRLVELPEVARARAAAFIITAGEGGALHLDDLRKRANDFDPMTRDRFLANALVPAAWVVQAQRVRHWFARRVARVFETVDVLIAPATPCTAPAIGTEWLEINGQRLPSRASMGLLTQPISCIGLPVATVPLWGMNPAAPQLPIGVQLIAAPWREDHCLRVAAALEARACAARRWRLGGGGLSDGLQPPRGAGRAARPPSRATKTRWSTTASTCSTSCSGTARRPCATASTKTCTASTPSATSAMRARLSAWRARCSAP